MDPSLYVALISIGTLRSTTATSTKTPPQNITLHCRKFLAVRPSPLHRTMWAKYPKNINWYERFLSKNRELYIHICALALSKILKFGDFTSLLCRVQHEFVLNCVPRVQHDYFSSFNQ